MKVESFLKELEALDHRERLQRLRAQVTTLAQAEYDAFVEALDQGDPYLRRLALYSELFRAAREPKGALEAAWKRIHSPSVALRSAAARVIGERAESIPSALIEGLDPQTLDLLLRRILLRRNGPTVNGVSLRQRLAQSVCERLSESGRFNEASVLLPACSPAWIATQLDLPWPDKLWRRLAMRHPELMLDRIAKDFASRSRPDLVWSRYDRGCWTALCRHAPEQIVGWLEAHADTTTLPPFLGEGLRILVRLQPQRMLRLMQQRVSWSASQSSLLITLARAMQAPEELQTLCRGLAQRAPTALTTLLGQLPFPSRGALFEYATARDDETAPDLRNWPLELLAILPTSLRDREAARMLALQDASVDASWRRQLLALRLIDKSREALEKEAFSPQAAERGEAYIALIRSSWRSPSGLSQTLRYLQRTRNDQDPVRNVVLHALSEVPGHRFHDAEALDAVVSPIFDARDTSYATRSAATRLAHRLLVAHASCPSSAFFRLGLSILERLAGQQGTMQLPRLDHNLPKGAETAIFESLRPWLEAASKRDQPGHLSVLWYALGKRAWKVSELDAMLGKLIWDGPKSNASTAATQWLADPKGRDRRVLELVKRDRSAIYVQAVFQHVCRRRQSLLPVRFAPKAHKGRFHDGRVVPVPTINTGLQHWPSSTQRLYEELLLQIEKDSKQFVMHRAGMTAQRARLPSSTVASFEDALASNEVAIQEAALGALVWLDEPRSALPVLLQHLDSDRARVAMYALQRLMQVIPRAELVEALDELLQRPKLKITVQKEALRLLGQLATPQAIALLQRVWAQKGLHRDVRIAAIHAARNMLELEEAWTLLAAACEDDEHCARAVVDVAPGNLAQHYRARYLGLLEQVARHPEHAARSACYEALARGWDSAAPEEAVRIAAEAMSQLRAGDNWRRLLGVLTRGARSHSSHSTLETLTRQLLEACKDDIVPGAEHDRIAHQRLDAWLQSLGEETKPRARSLQSTLVTAILQEAEFWPLAARLAVAAATNEALPDTALALSAAASTPGRALALAMALENEACREARNWEQGQSEQVLSALMKGEANARRLAVTWLECVGPEFDWPRSLRDALVRLRRDEDLDVRTAALSLWVAC